MTKNWSWMENKWILLKEGKRLEHQVSHWLYSAAELHQFLSDCGFRKVDVYGDMEGAPYDHLAKRLIVVANK